MDGVTIPICEYTLLESTRCQMVATLAAVITRFRGRRQGAGKIGRLQGPTSAAKAGIDCVSRTARLKPRPFKETLAMGFSIAMFKEMPSVRFSLVQGNADRGLVSQCVLAARKRSRSRNGNKAFALSRSTER